LISVCLIIAATDNLSTFFTMDSNSGRITTNGTLSSFDESSVTLWVEAKDEQGAIANTVVRITVIRLVSVHDKEIIN